MNIGVKILICVLIYILGALTGEFTATINKKPIDKMARRFYHAMDLCKCVGSTLEWVDHKADIAKCVGHEDIITNVAYMEVNLEICRNK